MKLTRSLEARQSCRAWRMIAKNQHDAFSILNAYASYDLNFGDSVGQLFVKGSNLTDELLIIMPQF